jgi:hypothetical protein
LPAGLIGAGPMVIGPRRTNSNRPFFEFTHFVGPFETFEDGL